MPTHRPWSLQVFSDREHICNPSRFCKVLCIGNKAKLTLLLLFLPLVPHFTLQTYLNLLEIWTLLYLSVHCMMLILRLCSLAWTSLVLSAVHPVMECSCCLHLIFGPVYHPSFSKVVCQEKRSAVTSVVVQTVHSMVKLFIWVGYHASFKAT